MNTKHKDIILPWLQETFTVKHASFRHIRMQNRKRKKIDRSYTSTFEIIKDYSKSSWKLGDIIKFDSGIYIPDHSSWKLWFLNEKDKDLYCKKNNLYNTNIPAYARNQYAIMLSRYRWVKKKFYATFKDYGSIMMMLTGKKIGHIRKYFMNTPYKRVGRYPYNQLKNSDELFNGIKPEDDVHIFLEKLIRSL